MNSLGALDDDQALSIGHSWNCSCNVFDHDFAWSIVHSWHFPRLRLSGSTPLWLPELVYLSEYWLAIEVFFKRRNGTILPCQVFTLYCPALALLTGCLAPAVVKKPSPIFLCYNFGTFTIKVIIIMLIIMIIKTFPQLNKFFKWRLFFKD